MPQSAQPVTLIATFRAQQGHDSTVLSLISAYGDLVRAAPLAAVQLPALGRW